jgi:hypothetical protein
MSWDPSALAVRRRFWPRLAVVLFVIAAAAIIVWLARPRTVTATSLFEVGIEAPSLLAHAPTGRESNYEILKKTQIALLKSKFLLTSAVRNPAIAGNSVFAGVPDPVSWLQDHLEVGYPQNGEILEIKLRGTESQADDIVHVVDAVAEAYKKEVLGRDRERQLAQRDMLERSLQNLNTQIKRNYEDYLDIAKALDRPNGENGGIKQQLDLTRLNRVEEELAQLEREQLKLETDGDKKESKFVAARIQQLRKRSAELEKSLEARAQKSVDLETRAQELKRLQQIADDMSVQLEKMDIDLNSPSRIRQIQTAVIESGRIASR